MKIALLRYDLSGVGGGPRQLLMLARGLIQRGHRITIFTTHYNPKACYPEFAAGLPIKSLEAGERNPNPSKAAVPQSLEALTKIHSLASLVRADSFDLINPHEWPASWVAVFAAKRGQPIVWMANDLWHVPELADNGAKREWRLKLRFFFDKLISHRIDRICVLDKRMASQISRFYGREAEVVRSGIDHDAFRPRMAKMEAKRLLGLPRETFLIFQASVVHRNRRFEDSIRSFALLPQKLRQRSLLLISGRPDDRVYLERLKGLRDRLHLASQIRFEERAFTEEELLLRLTACDCLIFPNINQTWGLTAIEAMATGRPVIVSRGSGVSEILDDGKTALLVPPRKPRAIAQALTLLMERPMLAQRIAAKGQRLIQTRFSWDAYTEAMLDVFERAVEQRR